MMDFQIKESYFNDGEYLQLSKKNVKINLTYNTLEKIQANKHRINEALTKAPHHVVHLKLTSNMTLRAGAFGAISFGVGHDTVYVAITKDKDTLDFNGSEWDELKQISLKKPSVHGTFPFDWNHTGIKVKTAVSWINHLSHRVSPWECNLSEFLLNSNFGVPENAMTMKQVSLYIPPADKLLRMCHSFLTENKASLPLEERITEISKIRLLHMYDYMCDKLNVPNSKPAPMFEPTLFCQTKPKLKENHNEILNEMLADYFTV